MTSNLTKEESALIAKLLEAEGSEADYARAGYAAARGLARVLRGHQSMGVFLNTLIEQICGGLTDDLLGSETMSRIGCQFIDTGTYSGDRRLEFHLEPKTEC